MKLVVGLGNPGREYAETRHNIGFWAVDLLADRWGLRFNQKRARSQVAEGRRGEERVALAKPLTYMNLSGEAVRQLMRELGVGLEDLVVVYDDVALPLGKLRLRRSGSAGTHNGMRNIVACLGSQEFARVRIGVGAVPGGEDRADFVLAPFGPDEQPVARDAASHAADAIESLLDRGWVPTLTEYNR